MLGEPTLDHRVGTAHDGTQYEAHQHPEDAVIDKAQKKEAGQKYGEQCSETADMTDTGNNGGDDQRASQKSEKVG